jgi:phage I-like protein
VVANLAREFNFQLAVIDYDENEEEWWLYSSTWVLLTHDPSLLAAPEIAAATTTPTETPTRSLPLWTDDFASLFQILK